jgi:hypothetical protein
MRPALLAACLTVSMSLPAIGWAQPAKPASARSDARTDQARELHVKGAALYEQGQFEKAEAAFLAAWALKQHHQIAANLGACEMKLGRFRDAAEHLAFFLREQPAGGNQDERRRTQTLFDEARAKIGTLTIDVDAPGAEVLIDDVVIGRSPLAGPVFVEPGGRRIVARLSGRPDMTRTLLVEEGMEKKVGLSLALAEVAPVVPPVVVVPERRPIWPVVVSAVLGAAGLAVGAGLTVAANGKGADIRLLQAQVKTGGSAYPCAGAQGGVGASCATLRELLAGRDGLSKAAATSLALGGAFGLVAAGWGGWLASTPRVDGANHSVRLVPTVGAREGSVVVIGEW